MIENLRTWINCHRDEMQASLRRCFAEERPLLLQTDLRGIFAGLAELGLDAGPGSPLDRVVRLLQEAVLQAPWACFAVREPPMSTEPSCRLTVPSGLTLAEALDLPP